MAIYPMKTDILQDVKIVARAGVDLVRIDVALRQSGFRRIVVEIEESGVRNVAAIKNQDLRRARRYGRRIANASRFSFPRFKCLHRSLVLHSWLRSEGLPSELQIGVIKGDEGLMAHAWVTLGGHIINDQPCAIAPFTPLTRWTTAGITSSVPRADMTNMRWR